MFKGGGAPKRISWGMFRLLKRRFVGAGAVVPNQNFVPKLSFVKLEGKASPKPIGFGYKCTRPIVCFLFNRGLALAMILCVLPLLIAISVMLLATQGSQIIYRGKRMGKDKEMFDILKFRTLDEKAAELTKSGVLPKGTNLETPLGGFLRDTRLDELPQLFNVLFGSMVFFGPRPVRAEIAAIQCRELPNFDARFSVKPGFVGFAQALMSHGSDKRHRAILNNKLVNREISYIAATFFVARVGFSVITRSISEVVFRARFGKRGIKPCPKGVTLEHSGQVYDVVTCHNDKLTLDGSLTLDAAADTKIYCKLRSGKKRAISVDLTGMPSGAEQVVTITPISSVSQYFYDRYVLHDVVLPPR